MDPMKNVEIDEAKVMEKFGVGPDRITDVQALIGDSVDNIPGVPGIGPKTAKLIIIELKDKFAKDLEKEVAHSDDTYYNYDFYWIPVENCQLVLFPGWLKHGKYTDEIEMDERIVIGFDCVDK